MLIDDEPTEEEEEEEEGEEDDSGSLEKLLMSRPILSPYKGPSLSELTKSAMKLISQSQDLSYLVSEWGEVWTVQSSSNDSSLQMRLSPPGW